MSRIDCLPLLAALAASILGAAGCRGPARDSASLTPGLSAPRSRSPAVVKAFSGKLPADRASSAGRGHLDGGGNDDCWEGRESGGSGAGGVILTIQAPCGSQAITIDTTSSFGDFLAMTALPPALAARPRLIDGVVDLLYGRAHLRRLDTIDGSFRWLIEHHLAKPGPESPPFVDTARYTPVWSPGPPALPESQVVVLAEPGLRALASSLAPAEELAPPSPAGAPFALLAYFAHNHHRLKQAARCGPLEVFTTDHGVVVHDTDKDASSWVYISTGVTKLRHPSLGRAACTDGLVLVERAFDDVRELLVAAPRVGAIGRIPLEGRWSLDERALTVEDEAIPLGDLAAALRISSSP
ncbi:hypothetical protein [Sorangium sp. So ce394]|uniref:hypothetical protein n=1 Tax=Sorangium sp. So ce394 TaxID=3133310 RepID=UPI003F5B08A4